MFNEITYLYLFSEANSADETDIPFFKNCVQRYFRLVQFPNQQFQEYMRKNSKNIADVTKYQHFQVFYFAVVHILFTASVRSKFRWR